MNELAKTQAPAFTHPEILELYEYGIDIPHEILHNILALPRESLIADLNTLLLDATNRYDYFYGRFENNESQEDDFNTAFALHAICLLNELKAEESLPNILFFLKGDYDFVHFWLGDHVTETLWQAIFTLGHANTGLLKDFLLNPKIDTYTKSAVSGALNQMVLCYPEKREEIRDVFTEIITTCEQTDIEDDLIDPSFLGLLVCDIIECQLSELLPVMKPLFEKEYIDLFMCGSFEEVEKTFEEEAGLNNKKVRYNIFMLYNHVLETWNNDNSDFEEKEGYDDEFPMPAVSSKIDRNAPCPCGSGKKYKKCCME